MFKKRKRIREISDLFNKVLSNKYDTNFLNGGDFTSNYNLLDALIELRALGLKIELPTHYLSNDCLAYYEIAAEVERQILLYLYPVKSWLAHNWSALIASVIAITSLIISLL